MKKLLVIALMILAIQIQAQVRIGSAEAYATAEQFVSRQRKQTVQKLTLSEEIKSEQTGQTNLFVFAIEPKGFVIVSALNEILAYSFTSSMPASDELPDHIAYWIGLYNEQTDYLLQHPDNIKRPAKQQRSVGPLLISVWGQGCFHNALCPEDELGPCHHVEAGCVAIAMAQIMYYYKQPVTGIGSMTYSCPPYGTLSADFGNTTYKWEDMVDTVCQSNYAVAKLISHCGISVQMIYGTHSSISSNVAANNAFHLHFYYPCSILSSRSSFTDEEWTALIRQNIENQRPVYYTGKSDLGAHAFVCDGYDNNGLFHFNFGWDGVADGYFTLENPYDFSTLQSCIHNIFPIATLPIQSDNHGIIYVAPDGSGNGSSWENATSDFQAAIYKSHANNATIWVKEGTYIDEPLDGYAYNFFGDCQLYGGFKGDEPYDYDLSLRDFEAHPSILEGNHSHGIFNMHSAPNSIIIDGFTIQNCNAIKGGVLVKCQTLIKNCKFLSNYSTTNGGGIFQQSPNSGSVVIQDCEFFGNEANHFGGALFDYGNTKCLSCQFINNIAHMNGGGVYNNSYDIPSKFFNCTFSNNTAKNGGGIATVKEGTTFWSCLINNNTAEKGGGCYLKNGANLYNCTIVKNEAQIDYGGVYSPPTSPPNEIRNCIIWGNVCAGESAQIEPLCTYTHCAVEEDLSESGYNFNADVDNDGESPRFYVRFQNPNVAAGNGGQGGDWRLQSNSLCINRGVDIAGQSVADLDGNPRCQHDKVDLGAYESNTAVKFINAYYCEHDPYYYQDSLLSALGLYTFLHPGYTYDSLAVIQMKDPPPTVFYTEEICENEMYDFIDTLINTSGQYTTTIDCITYKLDLTVHPLTSFEEEAEICEGETYNFFGMPLEKTGTYSTIFDCQLHQLNLTVSPLLPIDYTEKTICEGDTYNFHGQKLQYAGHYQTTIDCQPYVLDLTVNPVPSLQCSGDTIVEFGEPVFLSATGADSYLWSTGDTTESILVFPKEDVIYSVEGFYQNGCSKTHYITVQVKNEIEKIVLFPNPAHDKVFINLPFFDELNGFNLFGEHIVHVDAHREAVELDVSHFAEGIYIVQVKQLKNLYYEKLVIVH